MKRPVMELSEPARSKSGQIVMRHEAVPLALLLKSVLERLALRIQESGVQLQTEIAPDLLPISGAGDQLAQVFSDLTDDAL